MLLLQHPVYLTADVLLGNYLNNQDILLLSSIEHTSTLPVWMRVNAMTRLVNMFVELVEEN